MIGKGSRSSRIATLPEVLGILEERKKDDSEQFGYELELSYEYAKRFSSLGDEKGKKMKDELVELGLSQKAAAKVMEVMPINVLQLKQVLVMEKKTYEEDELAKVIATVDKYRQ